MDENESKHRPIGWAEVADDMARFDAKFKPQTWHVEFDTISGHAIIGFETRKVAEESCNDINNTFENLEPHAFYCLCDCESRECKYLVRIAGL